MHRRSRRRAGTHTPDRARQTCGREHGTARSAGRVRRPPAAPARAARWPRSNAEGRAGARSPTPKCPPRRVRAPAGCLSESASRDRTYVRIGAGRDAGGSRYIAGASGCGEIGIHDGFRCHWGQPRGGSSPLSRIYRPWVTTSTAGHLTRRSGSAISATRTSSPRPSGLPRRASSSGRRACSAG